jgi:uncharacterized membrane protein HdeD (DUF308 family)
MLQTQEPERRGMMVLGALSLVVGILALAGRSLGLDVFEVGWPLLVIVPGLLLLAAADG